MPPDTVVLAHHALVLAIPAFVPAIAITVVVLVVARRDRVAEARELAAQEPAAREPTTHDTSPAPAQENDR